MHAHAQAFDDPPRNRRLTAPFSSRHVCPERPDRASLRTNWLPLPIKPATQLRHHRRDKTRRRVADALFGERASAAEAWGQRRGRLGGGIRRVGSDVQASRSGFLPRLPPSVFRRGTPAHRPASPLSPCRPRQVTPLRRRASCAVTALTRPGARAIAEGVAPGASSRPLGAGCRLSAPGQRRRRAPAWSAASAQRPRPPPSPSPRFAPPPASLRARLRQRPGRIQLPGSFSSAAISAEGRPDTDGGAANFGSGSRNVGPGLPHHDLVSVHTEIGGGSQLRPAMVAHPAEVPSR